MRIQKEAFANLVTVREIMETEKENGGANLRGSELL